MPQIFYHKYDLPFSCYNILRERSHDKSKKGLKAVCIDTESMGLKYTRDRLCLVQFCFEFDVSEKETEQEIHLVHFPEAIFHQSENLISFLKTPSLLKIFHYARFDIGILKHTFYTPFTYAPFTNIFCTKIASHLARTYSDKHSLKDLVKELLDIELSKEQQKSNWGNKELTDSQKKYASLDVCYLLKLKEILSSMLLNEKRQDLAQVCFDFLPHRCTLDSLGGESYDVFAYKCNL
jgi:ribonuclease D